MDCLPNINSFSERNIDKNADLAVLVTEYLHSERRKCFERNSAPFLILPLNGFTFRL